MKTRKETKGNIASMGQQGNRNGNTGKRIVSGTGNGKTGLKRKPVRVKAALNVSIKKMEEQLPAEFLKTFKNLNAIIKKIDKLEKEKKKIIRGILKNDPKSVNS